MDSFSELSKLGEFGLISKLTQGFSAKHKSTIFGIGDDAAVLGATGESSSVKLVSVDNLTEGTHFLKSYTPLQHLGYKAVSTAVSDIYAMNGVPREVLISLSVSNHYSVEMLELLYSGIQSACEVFQVDLVGGDTTSSKLGLTINVTALGDAEKSELTYRHGSNVNDILIVTGDLGAAYMGWKILDREYHIAKSNPTHEPDLDRYHYLLERQLRPQARKDIVTLLKNANIQPTSMIDISDGLSSEVLHLCKSSELGCKIFEDKIPVDPAVMLSVDEFSIPLSIPILHGGEDYELLFTIKPSDYEKIKEIKELSAIGHMTSERGVAKVILSSGMESTLQAQGWDQLKN